MNRSEILERCLKTFLEGALAALIANITVLEGAELETLPSVLLPIFVGAVGAGISAVINGVIQPAITKRK